MVQSYTALLVAAVLILMTACLIPTLTRRFKHVGWRYRTAVVSGVVFVASVSIGYIHAGITGVYLSDDRGYMLIVDILQVVSGIILAASTIGYVDVVFNNRKRTISDR